MGIHDGHREKMRRRFQKQGLEGFADHEALELLLYYAIPRRDTNELAHRLLNRYGSLSALLRAPEEDLQRVEGMGEYAAVLLKLVPAFAAKAHCDDGEEEIVLNSTERAGEYLLRCFAQERNEVIYQLCLDRKGKLLACKRLGEGGISTAALSVRRMMENAILSGASGVILSHNHPSGIALPSREDYGTTQQAKDALLTIGVELLDHIIVAENDYVSLADSGILPRRK